MSTKSSIEKTIEIVGINPLASKLRLNGNPITYQAIRKWEKLGRMPYTEFSGGTNYARQIETLTKGKVTVTMLLGYIPPHQEKLTKKKKG